MTEQEKWNLVKGIRLRVPYLQARNSLRGVDHKALASAIEGHWISEGENVTPWSKCWLFCWAATGTNSEVTAGACKSIWNNIFSRDRGYEWFRINIGHGFARKYRYPPRMPREYL